MRLWHIDLIPYLPKSQLLAQWRELNSIFKKQDKHILINYIYNYDKHTLYKYTNRVLTEMFCRGYKFNKNNYSQYFNTDDDEWIECGLDRFDEHNDEYLTICYYNLKEKYLRGQKDFTDEIMYNLNEFYSKRRNKNE